MKINIPEKILVYKVRTAKDKDAFAKLYDLYINQIYRFVYFKVSHREHAEDITSEVFLRVWHSLAKADAKEVKHFRGFLYRVARNCIVDWYRDQAKKQEQSLESIAEIPDHSEIIQDLSNKQDAEKLILLIKRLKREYQEVLFLKYIDQLSTAEIAKILGKKKTAVRVMLHRATKKLKELAN